MYSIFCAFFRSLIFVNIRLNIPLLHTKTCFFPMYMYGYTTASHKDVLLPNVHVWVYYCFTQGRASSQCTCKGLPLLHTRTCFFPMYMYGFITASHKDVLLPNVHVWVYHCFTQGRASSQCTCMGIPLLYTRTCFFPMYMYGFTTASHKDVLLPNVHVWVYHCFTHGRASSQCTCMGIPLLHTRTCFFPMYM